MEMTLQAEVRPKMTRSELNRMRRNGRLPAILLDHPNENTMLLLSERKFIQWIRNMRSQVINLEIAGKGSVPVLLEDVQRDPVTGKLLHADFLKVKMDEAVRVKVPVDLTGTPAGVKAGGIMQVQEPQIEVEGLPNQLPAAVSVDISHLEIGDSLAVKDITVPEGITVLSSPEEVIVSILPPKATGGAEETAEEAETAEA